MSNQTKQAYTSHDAAKILGVSNSSVLKWIDDEKLAAYRTPGGHRRIKPEDLRAFAAEYEMPFAAGDAGEGKVFFLGKRLPKSLKDYDTQKFSPSDMVKTIVAIASEKPAVVVQAEGDNAESVLEAIQESSAGSRYVLVAEENEENAALLKSVKKLGGEVVASLKDLEL